MATTVKYYYGTTLIGEGTVAPDYPVTTSAIPEGSHVLKREVWVDGVLKGSDTVNVTVNAASSAITANAVGIFSLNKLNPSYAGSAIEIVPVNTAVTPQDIGFDGAGFIDTSAVEAYATTNSGSIVVSKFYNQMGGANFIQATDKTTNPEIAFNGVTKKNSNLKPTMYFSGTKFLNGAFSLGTNFTIVIAYESTIENIVKAILEEVNISETANRMAIYSDTSASGALSVGYQPSGGSLTTIPRGSVLTTNTMTVQSIICNNGTITARLDGVAQSGTIAKQIIANAKLTLGKQSIGTLIGFQGNNANVLIYNVAKTTTEIQAIESEINAII